MVNDDQKKAMAKILAAMNRAETGAANPEGSKADPNVAAMSEIMARFRQATNNVRENAQHDDVLMEALQTERTETGVRIAEWEISITENAKHYGKFYDITNTGTGSKIASNLRLYEAALLLTKELNRGSSITSFKVKEILRLEEEFSKNLDDAARYARIVKQSTGEKRIIAEARYSDARSKAIAAKEQVRNVR